ncbi:MAG: DNA cytosine methyltransferase [Mariprofundaceae bacterium]
MNTLQGKGGVFYAFGVKKLRLILQSTLRKLIWHLIQNVNIYPEMESSVRLEVIISNLEGNSLTAPFTHYLYTSKYDFSATDKAGALEYVQNVLLPDLSDEVAESALQGYLFKLKKNILFPEFEKATFKFIDLFAGIGGFRIAMQNLGGVCAFSNERDKYPQKTING